MAKIKYVKGMILADKEEVVKNSNKILADAYRGRLKSQGLQYGKTNEIVEDLKKSFQEATLEIKDLKAVYTQVIVKLTLLVGACRISKIKKSDIEESLERFIKELELQMKVHK